jgi:hypothetical protein
MGEALNPILNYVEFRTDHEPYMVHGVVQGDRYSLIVKSRSKRLNFLKRYPLGTKINSLPKGYP